MDEPSTDTKGVERAIEQAQHRDRQDNRTPEGALDDKTLLGFACRVYAH
jgi:hypothetical protein